MEKLSFRLRSGLRRRFSLRHGSEPGGFFGRNLLGVSAVEFSWGLGLPLVIDSSFLPLFLRNLGASNLIIGAVPTLYFIGCAVFPLVSGLLTDGRGNKKRAVILTHLFPAVTTILLGLFLNLFGTGGEPETGRVVIPLFLTGYAVFSMGIGMLLPVWQNYLVTIFSPQSSVPALAVMMIAQSGSKLGSSLIIQEFVKRYGFAVAPTSVFFVIVGTLFTVGSLCFVITRERGTEPGERGEPRRPPLEALRTVSGTGTSSSSWETSSSRAR
jgi:MFS family permease